ncbi:MAG: 3-hydroxyacyl-CoA dehydrogenase NAD-binding domain-containing protein [Gammaproteobacteria bacterium]
MNSQAYKNWHFNIDDAQIAWLHFDNANSKVNILHTTAVKELNDIVDEIKNNKPKALVILSDKSSAFCMGADIHEFADNTDLEAIKAHVMLGQSVMQKINDLPFPSIALIHGFCLGGGLELALACRYRIAQENALLGLPEVRLGIEPAWGGSVRLPSLIHPLKALNMILTGGMVKAILAKKMGLVDAVVPQRQRINAARYIALNGVKRHKQLGHFLASISFIRNIAAFFIHEQVLKKANPAHYPAPYQIIENWQKFGAKGSAAYQAEVDGFMHLLKGETAKNLVRIFLLQEELKSVAKKVDEKITRVHVIGAGTMGADIAIWCMQKGLNVSLQDKTVEALNHAMMRAHELCQDKRLLDKLIPDVNGDGIAHADLIIEAVFEDLTVKQAVFNEIKQKMKDNAIVASNTSSISLTEFPYPIVGIHFFNPVGKMQLVEVVHTDKLPAEITERALAFVHQIGKLPIKVKNCPGFLVNRTVAPYLFESVLMLEEGMPVEQLDKIATDFGMVMGPGMMVDLIGLDICLAAMKNLGATPPQILLNKIEHRHFGKKNGEGFYTYANGKPIKIKPNFDESVNNQEVIERILLPLINECVACLGEGIVDSTDIIDAALIFGAGFAPYIGGPMQYAKTIGYDKIFEKLKAYEQKYGSRFTPKPGWDLLIKL